MRLATLVISPIVLIMGCPCCGPLWYRKLIRKACQIDRIEIPPEAK